MSEAPKFVSETADAIPIFVLQPDALETHLASLSAAQQTWVTVQRFKATPGQCVQVPGENGAIAQVLVGAPGDAPRRTRFDFAKIARMLPQATYKIVSDLEEEDLNEALNNWKTEAPDRFKDILEADDAEPS